jgi:hypothetical protein
MGKIKQTVTKLQNSHIEVYTSIINRNSESMAKITIVEDGKLFGAYQLPINTDLIFNHLLLDDAVQNDGMKWKT